MIPYEAPEAIVAADNSDDPRSASAPSSEPMRSVSTERLSLKIRWNRGRSHFWLLSARTRERSRGPGHIEWVLVPHLRTHAAVAWWIGLLSAFR